MHGRSGRGGPVVQHLLLHDVTAAVGVPAVVDKDPLEVADGEEVLLGGVAALLRLLGRVESALREVFD